MKTITPTELRGNVYKFIDDVLETGVPLEVRKGRMSVRIVPVEQGDKLANLSKRPNFIRGNPDELADLHWDKEMDIDLP